MDISLVVMPFYGLNRPALGVSLLQAGLKQVGISSKIYYFNLDYAEICGIESYNEISEYYSALGEFIFSRIAFGRPQWELGDLENFLCLFLSRANPRFSKNIGEIMKVRDHINAFIGRCTLEILNERPKLIGFSSVFHQHCASIAVARSIKQIKNIPIIFGGANCEGEMGLALLNCVPHIDFVCSGEGDIAFIEFVRTLFKDVYHKDSKINGIINRSSNYFDACLTSPVIDMNSLPIPNFDDYFQALNNTSFVDKIDVQCIMETSRGCWWGEKSQCTFCGLNGSTMRYRSKSIPRVLDEMKQLTSKYGKKNMVIVDNILDFEYIDNLFPEVYHRGLDIDLFYETKSNLSKQQLRVMKQGGVSGIQPGIESLSTPVLRIMKKGVSALQNIQLLKWCKELCISPTWNFLYGFPGEPVEEYDRIAEIVPLLEHLDPPSGIYRISLDRFSPYFLEPDQNGIINIQPRKEYSAIYPFSDDQIKRMVYHFQFDYSDGRDPSTYVKKLEKEVDKWIDTWKKKAPFLVMASCEDSVVICDTRSCATQKILILGSREGLICKICEYAHSFNSIYARYKVFEHDITELNIYKKLNDLIDKKVMLCDGNMYLSLAIPISPKN